jgi:hypothetical protein
MWERAVISTYAGYQQTLGADERGCTTRKNAGAAARSYLADIWIRALAAGHTPFYAGVPSLRIGYAVSEKGRGFTPAQRNRAIRNGTGTVTVATRVAHARAPTHGIYCRLSALTRPTLIHEAAHLLTWADPNHGPQFWRVLIDLWQRELAIPAAAAIDLAAEHGVIVGPMTAAPKDATS